MSKGKRASSKEILQACRMAFEGVANREIASLFGITEATVSNWRKLEIWQDFEADLIAAYKEKSLETVQVETPSSI